MNAHVSANDHDLGRNANESEHANGHASVHEDVHDYGHGSDYESEFDLHRIRVWFLRT